MALEVVMKEGCDQRDQREKPEDDEASIGSAALRGRAHCFSIDTTRLPASLSSPQGALSGPLRTPVEGQPPASL